tara:strand:- start:906 stop:1106 length:201 start_codon:yes stop_codon:yes gene_type:complete
MKRKNKWSRESGRGDFRPDAMIKKLHWANRVVKETEKEALMLYSDWVRMILNDLYLDTDGREGVLA